MIAESAVENVLSDTCSVRERSMKRGKSKKQRPKMVLSSLTREQLRRRTASLMWESENDPFQVFEVEHESCIDLEINVKHGEGITKGSSIQDLLDTPDPYVLLQIPGSSNCTKRTSHIDNAVNPIWNETFHFYLDPKKQHKLKIILMDANFMTDEHLGENELDVELIPMDEPRDFIVDFISGSKIHLTITRQKNKTPDLRFSLALCEEEKTYLRLRRTKVMANMQNMLKERGPTMTGEVPVIAILGSGGGFRAMTCLSGAVKALHQSGILACATYIAGLSGSSWLISTLYAHDKFPNVTYEDIYDELYDSVTHNWYWNLAHSYHYLIDMVRKYRGGQPVSFTDIFGHLLGDVLLRGKKHKKLSDQRAIVEKGNVPFPLYTCLHAKESVSCKTFSEWIEFSPYEIGIAKYGTFMKTEDFGSKFIVGKLVKKYPEFPLHYLQGVWGSAFTILMKRVVLSGGTKQDLVQMMRDANEERAINEQLEDDGLGQRSEDSPLEKESETDDETEIEGADDELLEDCNADTRKIIEDELNDIRKSFSSLDIVKEQKIISDHSTDAVPQGDVVKKGKKLKVKFFSFDFPKKSEDLLNGNEDGKNRRKLSMESNPETLSELTKNLQKHNPKIKRQGAIREGSKESTKSQQTNKSTNYWTSKRELRKSRRTRKSSIIQELMKKSNILNSRAGRAGEILNPFRGLSLKESFPLSPLDTSFEEDESIDENDLGLGSRYEALDHKAKKLFIVDSGLAFNSPFPLLLRPQRAVDIYLSFDFSQRPTDKHMPFEELILAQKWAVQNKVPFPPVEQQAEIFAKEDKVRELYIFKDDSDPTCPVILHFTIVNNKFRTEKAPGVPRETKEEFDFADFSLFEEPTQPYASTNFIYEPLQYERLVRLVEYNTLLCIDEIKEEIVDMIEKKRKLANTSVDHTFLKIQKIMDACKKFKSVNGLRIKVDEGEAQKFLSMWKHKTRNNLEDSSMMFYDAQEDLESDDEYETDEGE